MDVDKQHGLLLALNGLLQPAEPHTDPIEADMAFDMHIEEILESFLVNERIGQRVLVWVQKVATEMYAQEISIIVRKDAGFQFSARNASISQLEAFDLDHLADIIQERAPGLWALLGVLLAADARTNKHRDWEQKRRGEGQSRRAAAQPTDPHIDGDGDTTMHTPDNPEIRRDSEDEYWEHTEALPDDVDEDERVDEAMKRRDELIRIKKVVCTSVLMQSSNQHCNALQSVIGVFLHSCGVPEAAIELFAHIGLSISTTAINDAISSLSKGSTEEMQRLGKTLLAGYAYDNLDIDLKHGTPTIEKPMAMLLHMTSATMLRLDHGVTHEDLNCSRQLWERSALNRHRQSDTPVVNEDALLNIHPEDEDHSSGLLRRDRFNVHVVLRDLVEHGPKGFHKFLKHVQKPEVIEQIPVVKSQQVPLRMMDISPSTPATNGDVLAHIFYQGGIDDTAQNSNVVGIANQVVLVHGDLLTGERIQSLLSSHSVEKNPWLHFQFVVCVMGLFRLKMACADAIWRVFIEPKGARADSNSLIEHVARLRPKETRRIESNPGFRRMHEVIQHVGIVSRLDCWRLAVEKLDPGFESLEGFAKSKPTFEQLEEIAKQIVLEHVGDSSFSERKRKQTDDRDKINENMALLQQYFLLYEEITYALNQGDIGRAEDCFMPWIYIFRGCGKHKYAAHMIKYLHNVHFVYPEGLKKTIRMNILCNPTGQPGKFRAIDWWVEHNNLFLKRIYGGKFSNHTKARIIKESPLIEVFKNTRIQVGKLFQLDHRTIRHSPVKLQKTFKALGVYKQREQANEFVRGRVAKYSVPDVMRNRMHLAMTKEAKVVVGTEGGVDVEELHETTVDGELEVEDDGDLDV